MSGNITNILQNSYFLRRIDVAQGFDFGVCPRAFTHQISVTDVTGSPGAGEVARVYAWPAGATDIAANKFSIPNAVIDLTNPTPIVFEGFFDKFEIAFPAGFSATDVTILASGC